MIRYFLPQILFLTTLVGGNGIAKDIDLKTLENNYAFRRFNVVELPSGSTHYQVVGSGPAVVLVHGVSGPLLVWDKTVDALVSAGYQVIRYDLFGRGFSGRLVNGIYDLEIYEKQLRELIAYLKLPQVRLVGSSFGAIVSTEYALRNPDRVSGLILIGPAGFPITVPWTARVRDLPVIGEWLTHRLSHNIILEQNDHYFVSGKLPEEIRPFISDQLSVPGTTNAILKTMKNSPVQSYIDSYFRLGKTTIPVGVIWGRKDRTFPYENSQILLKAAPQAHLITIEDAGHLPQYEKYQEVNPALIEIEKNFK